MRRGNLINGEKINNCFVIPFLPFGLRRIKFMALIDKVVFSIILKLVNYISPFDVIILTHPLLFHYAKWHPGIVYDMHDDNANFYPSKSFLHRYINKANGEALQSANFVTFSSKYLQKKFFSNAKYSVVIRNGHKVNLQEMKEDSPIVNNNKKLFYFGTVSKWFDLELIVRSVNRNKNIEYNIIGPADIHKPHHQRIKWHGPLQHSVMLDMCSIADAFIMPFHVSPLIEGVDPIKLYEYISFRRPVIVKYYMGISQFRPFVYFYHDEESYHILIDKLQTNDLPAKGKDKEVIKFLGKSSWEARAEEMLSVIRCRVLK